MKGIPGVKTSLLEEFGVHLVTYDLPGFGEIDPHPNRSFLSGFHGRIDKWMSQSLGFVPC